MKIRREEKVTRTYNTLIKMHKHFLNEKRREVAILDASREQIRNVVRRLNIEFVTEQEFVSKAPEKAYTFSEYAKLVKKKKASAEIQIEALDKEISHISEQILEAFGEMKKYQIIKEKKEAEEAKELLNKNQVELDEIGGVTHQRKKEAAQ